MTSGWLGAVLALGAAAGCSTTTVGRDAASAHQSGTILDGVAPPALPPDAPGSERPAAPTGTQVPSLGLPQALGKRDMLPFRVVDSAFSAALDRAVFLADDPPALHVLEPASHQTRSVLLSEGGLMLSMAPNGRVAAVLQNGKVAVFDVATAALRATYAIKPSITRIIVTNDRIFGLPEQSSEDFVALELATGRQVTGTRSLQWLGRGVVAGPLARVYAPTRGLSPGDIGRLQTNDKGEVTWTHSRMAAYKHSTCGDLWASADGLRIFSGCGSVLRGSESPEMDMVYDGQLPFAGVQALAHLPGRGELALVPRADRRPRDGQIEADDRQLFVLAYEGFGVVGRSDLPVVAGPNQNFPTHGRAVFAALDGRAFHMLLEADSAAGLSHGFALITLRRDGSPLAPALAPVAIPAKPVAIAKPAEASPSAEPTVTQRDRSWRARDMEPLRISHTAANDLVDLGSDRKLGKCAVSIGEPERLLKQLSHLLSAGVTASYTVRELVVAREAARPIFAMLLTDSDRRPLADSQVVAITGTLDAERAAVCVHRGHANLDEFLEESTDLLSEIQWQRDYTVRFAELSTAWYRVNHVERYRLEIHLPGVVRPHVLSEVGSVDVAVGFESVMIGSEPSGNHRLIRRGLFVSPGTKLSTLRDIETIEVGDDAGVLQEASFRDASPGKNEDLVLTRTGAGVYSLGHRIGEHVARLPFANRGDLAGPLVKDQRLREAAASPAPFAFTLSEFRPEYAVSAPTIVSYSHAITDVESELLIDAAGHRMIGKLARDGRLDTLRTERGTGARLERAASTGAVQPFGPRTFKKRKADRSHA